MVAAEPGQLGQERVALGPLVDDRRVPEADVHGGGAGVAVERGGERLAAVLARLLGARLHVGLVDLDDVGAGREQVADLGVDRGGVVERELGLALVVVVLRLLGHRERPRHGHLGPAVGVRLEELEVAELDGVPALDLPHHSRDRVRVAAAVEGGAGVVEVDAGERVGEAVGVALAALLAVGDDVEPGALLLADGEQRRVVLRLLDPPRIDAPELTGAHARREARGELLAVDQPVRLGVGADEAGRERRGHSPAVSRIRAATSSARAPSVERTRSAPPTQGIVRACSTSAASPDQCGGSRAMMRAANVSGAASSRTTNVSSAPIAPSRAARSASVSMVSPTSTSSCPAQTVRTCASRPWSSSAGCVHASASTSTAAWGMSSSLSASASAVRTDVLPAPGGPAIRISRTPA